MMKGGQSDLVDIKNKREQELILYLSQDSGYQTAQNLAKHFSVSSKTIYRTINSINKKFSDETQEELIISEKGKGFKLNYKSYINLKAFASKNALSYDVTPQNRRNNIIEEILISSPKELSVDKLYEKYYVSDSVITTDEKEMAKMLKKYNLTLHRKNRKLNVTGEETDLRKAIADLSPTLNFSDFNDLFDNDSLDFDRSDVEFIYRQIQLIEQLLDSDIPYPYNVNFFIHLYIMLSRFKKVKHNQLDSQLGLSKQYRDEMMTDEKIYCVANHIYENTIEYLKCEVPEIEVYNIFQYLISTRIQNELSTKKIEQIVKDITLFYIDEMKKHISLSEGKERLYDSLVDHIRPMLNRLNNGITIKNELNLQIKQEYPEIFNYVASVSKDVSKKFEIPLINDDEIGFITLYFAIELEKNQERIQTLIVCTTGIGTSELFKTKVEKFFPELDISDVISSSSVESYLEKHPNIQLVLSTVQLTDELNIPCLIVTAMFTVEDQNRLMTLIEEIK